MVDRRTDGRLSMGILLAHLVSLKGELEGSSELKMPKIVGIFTLLK